MADSIVSGTRLYNPYAELRHGTFVLLEDAEKKQPGWLYLCMSSLITTAFAFEAFLNTLGDRVQPYWSDLERLLRWDLKLRLVADRTRTRLDFGTRPLQTTQMLFDFRNELAHPKPKELRGETRAVSGDIESIRRDFLKVPWEKSCTIEFAQRAFEDTGRLAEKLWESAAQDPYELTQSGHGYAIKEL